MLTLFLIFLLILVAFLLLLILFGFFIYIFDAFLELPYVATKRNKVSTIIELASLKKGETTVDLGSGDGRLLFASAQKGAKAIGYELNPLLVYLTRLKVFFLSLRGAKRRGNLKPNKDRHGNKNDLAMTSWGSVKVYRSDLWKADLRTADVIFVYARQGTMKRMEDFVYKFARKGSRIVVNTDLTKSFPTKKPIKKKDGAYLYKA